MGMAGPAKRLLHGPEPVEDGVRHHHAEDREPDTDVGVPAGRAHAILCCAIASRVSSRVQRVDPVIRKNSTMRCHPVASTKRRVDRSITAHSRAVGGDDAIALEAPARYMMPIPTRGRH
jgi:hypothetical protein